MGKSRKRWVVARILCSMALLAVVYLGSYLCMHWAFHNGYHLYAEPVLVNTRPLWRPIEMYQESALPSGFDMMTLEMWLCRNGSSWRTAQLDAARQMRLRQKWRETKARIAAETESD